MGKIIKSMGKEEPADMSGVTTRVNKAGDRVYEIQLDYLRGHIKDASLKMPPEDHPEYGKTMEFEVEAESGAKCVLQIPFDSAYARGFLYAAPGIDLGFPVEFEPYQYFSKKKEREATGLSLIQNGEQLPWAYGTKDNPGGVPTLKKITYKGKETWDNSDQLEFLEGKFLEFCAQFKEVVAERVQADPATVPAATEEDDF